MSLLGKDPAITTFVSQIEIEFALAQVLIRREGKRFSLRHVQDSAPPVEALRLVSIDQLRALAQFTESGAFRPLKSAPNLPRGWRCECIDAAQLELALNQLYPGAVADWFAVRNNIAAVTNYREFATRQSGMYRITTFLNDAQAGQMIRACCHPRFCLKQRLWSVEGTPPDSAVEKSAIPCLEPCAILLEFARKIVRLNQEEEAKPALADTDVAARCEDAKRGLQNPDPQIRESDFNDPNNPRCLQFVLEKYCATPRPTAQ